MAYYNNYRNGYNFKQTYTEENKTKILKAIVDLWNNTQEYLPKVKYEYLSINIKHTLLVAYDYYGSKAINELFIRVNNTPRLNGMNNKDNHTSIDFVCELDNFSKIMNGNYDEVYTQDIKDEMEEVKPIGLKAVYYRLKQELGFTDADQEFDERYIFTEQERERLANDGRYMQGRYISIPVEADTPNSNTLWY